MLSSLYRNSETQDVLRAAKYQGCYRKAVLENTLRPLLPSRYPTYSMRVWISSGAWPTKLACTIPFPFPWHPCLSMMATTTSSAFVTLQPCPFHGVAVILSTLFLISSIFGRCISGNLPKLTYCPYEMKTINRQEVCQIWRGAVFFKRLISLGKCDNAGLSRRPGLPNGKTR